MIGIGVGLPFARSSGAGAPGGGGGVLKPQDVFKAWTYTGDSAAGGQDLAGGPNFSVNDGMAHFKARNANDSHFRYFASRPAKGVNTDLNSGEQTFGGDPSFTSNGLTASGAVNGSGKNYVAYGFRKAPKFFDIVFYTGDGNGPRVIPHSLGITPGKIEVKRLDITGNWTVWQRSLSANRFMTLNSNNTGSTSSSVFSADPTAADFTVGAATAVNGAGGTFVAILYAHDTSADGLIQCGGISLDASGAGSVTLPWRPQFVELKCVSTTGDWTVLDTARGINNGGGESAILLNSALSETSASNYIELNASGFTIPGSVLSPNGTYIFTAIREPY